MKNLGILSLFILLIVGLSFSACKKDDDLGPTLSLKTGEGYTYQDFEVAEGTTLKFGVSAEKSTNSDKNLKRFNIYYTSGNQELTLVDSIFDSTSFNADYNIEFLGSGSASLKFRITAAGDLNDETELNAVIN